MASLTREQLLAAPVVSTQVVAVPELGGDVTLSEMSGADRDDWDATWLRREAAERSAALKEKRAPSPDVASRDYAARLVAWTARNADGSPMFLVRSADGRVDAAATEACVPALAKFGHTVLSRLLGVAERLNGWGQNAIKAAEGNSGGTPSA